MPSIKMLHDLLALPLDSNIEVEVPLIYTPSFINIAKPFNIPLKTGVRLISQRIDGGKSAVWLELLTKTFVPNSI